MNTTSNKLLEEALGLYNFENAKITFIRHNENMTYSVEHSNNKYLFRIHTEAEGLDFSFYRGDFSRETLITGEIDLLNRLLDNGEIELQRPIKNKNGLYVARLANGIVVTALSWIEGKTLSDIEPTNELVYKVGQMVGSLHKSSKLLPHINRCQYDEKFIEKFLMETRKANELRHIKAAYCEKFEIILMELNKALQIQKDRFTIIHADLSKSNMVYDNNKISPIDFSMCGYGIPEMDLGDLFINFKNNALILDGYKSVNDCKLNQELLELCVSFGLISYIIIHHNQLYEDDNFQSKIDRWCLNTFDPLIEHLNT